MSVSVVTQLCCVRTDTHPVISGQFPSRLHDAGQSEVHSATEVCLLSWGSSEQLVLCVVVIHLFV